MYSIMSANSPGDQGAVRVLFGFLRPASVRWRPESKPRLNH
jgi:hypothetical protein